MSFLDRIRQSRPNYSTKVIATPELKADPIAPVLETPEPLTRLVQMCAACGESEATHPISVGWFYLGRLPHVGVCEACYIVAKDKERQHHLSQKKTALSVPVVSAKPSRVRRVALAEMPVERTSEQQLEERAYNLATGS